MPPLETADCLQQALMWPFLSKDRYGEDTFSLPSVIKVRWIDKKGRVSDPKENTIQLDAQVVAKQRLPMNCMLWLASTANPVTEFSNLQNSGASGRGLMRVDTDQTTPDLKNRIKRFEFGLKRYKDVIMPISASAWAGTTLRYVGSLTDYAGAQ